MHIATLFAADSWQPTLDRLTAAYDALDDEQGDEEMPENIAEREALTDQIDALSEGSPRWIPEDIARAALWLASDAASFVSGHALVVDGALSGGRGWSEAQAGMEMMRAALTSKSS